MIRFGRVVKERREELGMSQSELAGTLNVAEGTVSAIEQGRRIRGVAGRTQAALDRALGWAPGSSHEVLGGGVATVLRPPHHGVTVSSVADDPAVRLLIDELGMAAVEDRDRLVAMLVAAARAWRDRPNG